MPHLTTSDVHVNSLLTGVSVAFLQDLKNYVSLRAFPICPVDKDSDYYPVYDIGDLLRDEAKPRAPGTESAGGSVKIDNTNYYKCINFAWHEDVPWPNVANADRVFNLKRDASENVAQKLITRCEKIWMDNFFAAAKGWHDWAGAASGGAHGSNTFNRWDVSGSDPCFDVGGAISHIRSATGYTANKIIMADDVFMLCKNHTLVTDRIKYTPAASIAFRGVVTEEILAALFGVEEVIVAKAVINTAAEGAADAISSMARNGLLICYAAPSPGLRRPSAGYSFSWNGLIGNDGLGDYANGKINQGGGMTPFMRMRQFPMQHLNSDRVEGEMPIDHKMIAGSLGLFMDNVIAA
jgi:hypothetical protein